MKRICLITTIALSVGHIFCMDKKQASKDLCPDYFYEPSDLNKAITFNPGIQNFRMHSDEELANQLFTVYRCETVPQDLRKLAELMRDKTIDAKKSNEST